MYKQQFTLNVSLNDKVVGYTEVGNTQGMIGLFVNQSRYRPGVAQRIRGS